MFLRNPFSAKTKELFFYNYTCFYCSMSGCDALHHIMGRESNSPLNCSPIHNISCHIGNSRLDSFEWRAKLLKKTKAFLDEEGYKPTADDLLFLKKHARLYNS